MLQFMGLQRVGHNLATVQFATPLLFLINLKKNCFQSFRLLKDLGRMLKGRFLGLLSRGSDLEVCLFFIYF